MKRFPVRRETASSRWVLSVQASHLGKQKTEKLHKQAWRAKCTFLYTSSSSETQMPASNKIIKDVIYHFIHTIFYFFSSHLTNIPQMRRVKTSKGKAQNKQPWALWMRNAFYFILNKSVSDTDLTQSILNILTWSSAQFHATQQQCCICSNGSSSRLPRYFTLDTKFQ